MRSWDEPEDIPGFSNRYFKEPKAAAIARRIRIEKQFLYTLKVHPTDDEKKVEDLPGIGNQYFANGDYSQALEHYTKAMEYCINMDETRDTALCLQNRSLAFLRLDEYADAWTDAKKAASICPNHAVAWYRVGAALRAMGKDQTACDREFAKAKNLDPGAWRRHLRWQEQVHAPDEEFVPFHERGNEATQKNEKNATKMPETYQLYQQVGSHVYTSEKHSTIEEQDKIFHESFVDAEMIEVEVEDDTTENAENAENAYVSNLGFTSVNISPNIDAMDAEEVEFEEELVHGSWEPYAQGDGGALLSPEPEREVEDGVYEDGVYEEEITEELEELEVIEEPGLEPVDRGIGIPRGMEVVAELPTLSKSGFGGSGSVALGTSGWWMVWDCMPYSKSTQRYYHHPEVSGQVSRSRK